MARSRFDFSVAISVLLLLQAVTPGPASAKDSGSLGPLPVAISADFDHPYPSQGAMYRTVISSVVPVVFATGDTGQMTARFGMDPADCFGLASWVPMDKGLEAIGPAVICLANAIVSGQEFNDWVDRNGKVKVDPGLVIPLGPPQPVEPIQPGQIPGQTRLNANRVIAQAFVSGCGSGSFRKYGNLIFEKGALAFKFWTDTRGRPRVELSASLAVFENHDRETWKLVREGCGEQLPPSPSDGYSNSFAGSSTAPPPDPSLLSGQMDLVVGEIESLLFQQHLDSKTGKSLLRQLGDAMTSLQRTQVDQAVHAMQKFRDSLATLDKQGLIDPAAAASLAKGALGIETFLTGHASLPLPPLEPSLHCSANDATCPDTLSSCKFTSWYVDGASIDPAPDGSPKHPFATLTEAFSRAAAMKLCGVTLMVAPARYAGPIEITRHTRIIGQRERGTSVTPIIEGAVTNRGPFLLEIQLVTLSWFRDAVSDGVFVDHPCAITRLDTVAVQGYRGFGVRQRGGSLRAQSTIVANTRAQPASLAQGAGMLLSCGVQASLHDVVLDSNESAGLLIAHPGTMVDALRLVVRGTRVHPSLAAAPDASLTYGGAVQVRHQAHLNATSTYISENWLGGVVVDTGGFALFDWGTISHTVPVPAGLFPEWPLGFGGTNAVAAREGSLRLSNVISTRAALCGVQVALAGELDLWGEVWGDSPRVFSSQVSRSQIGACVNIPGYRLSRIDPSTEYVDNGTNIQAEGDFPIPSPSSPDGL